MSDKKRCGMCEHFNRAQGMFGHCGKTNEVAFAGDETCGEFAEIKLIPPKAIDFGKRAILNPFDPFMGLFPGAFLSKPMKDSGTDYSKKEESTWENPIFRRKRPVRKVIDFKEAGEKIRKRKKLTRGGL